MKVKTKIQFRDKDTKVVHEIGSEFECAEERGKYLIDLGYVEKSKQPKAEPKVEEKPAESEVKNPEGEVSAETVEPKVEEKKEPKAAKEGKNKPKPFVDTEEENSGK